MEILPVQEVSRRRDRGRLLQREGNPSGLPESSLALLSSFSVDLLPPFLTEALDRLGLYGRVYQGGFSQTAQEILDLGSGLYAAEPDAVLLVPAVEDLLAPYFERPLRWSPEEVDALVQERAEEWRGFVTLLLERLPSAACYVVVPA